MQNLATIVGQQGRFPEAEKLLCEVFEIEKDSLGASHPLTLITMGNFALTRYRQAKYSEAESLQRQTLKLSTQKFGENHPATKRSATVLRIFCTGAAWKLANAVDPEKHDPEKAVEFARKAIDLVKDRANNWNTLGVALYRNGKFKEAVAALEKANTMLEGKDRSHRPFLAMSHWILGDKQAALKYYRQFAVWFRSKPQSDEYQRFLNETESLLGLPASKPAKTPGKKTPGKKTPGKKK